MFNIFACIETIVYQPPCPQPFWLGAWVRPKPAKPDLTVVGARATLRDRKQTAS